MLLISLANADGDWQLTEELGIEFPLRHLLLPAKIEPFY